MASAPEQQLDHTTGPDVSFASTVQAGPASFASADLAKLADLADVGDFDGLDWNDLDAVTAASSKLLDDLARDRAALTRLAGKVPSDPHLAGLCEHYDILDKIVLHDDPSGWRLRLHVFLPGYFDRPHNHRWTYTSRLLTGSYVHTLFGTEDQLPQHQPDSTDSDGADGPHHGPREDESRQVLDVSTLMPRLIRTETAGSEYTLHHSMIHSVTAAPFTTSLIVRGPAVKDRFLVSDRATGEAWWQYGAAGETTQQAAAKRMSRVQLADRLRTLAGSGVLEADAATATRHTDAKA